ncbi:hypothetical protein Dimus_013207 [Dionaea muscipula]
MKQWKPVFGKDIQQEVGGSSFSQSCGLLSDNFPNHGEKREGDIQGVDADFPGLSSMIVEAQETLERCQQLLREHFSEDNRERMRLACDNLKMLLAWEDGFLRQMAKDEWIRFNDRNTKYFYNLVQGRQRRSRICGVFTGDGVLASSNSEIGSVFIAFFTELLDDKAPSVDGFTALFFKKSWGVVGDEGCWIVKVAKGKTALARARRRCIAAVVYCLWQERNSRIFRNVASSHEAVIRQILWFVDLPTV